MPMWAVAALLAFAVPSTALPINGSSVWDCTNPSAVYERSCWATLNITDYLMNSTTGTLSSGREAAGNTKCGERLDLHHPKVSIRLLVRHRLLLAQ